MRAGNWLVGARCDPHSRRRRTEWVTEEEGAGRGGVARHRAAPVVVVVVSASLISRSGHGSDHSSESGSFQAGHKHLIRTRCKVACSGVTVE